MMDKPKSVAQLRCIYGIARRCRLDTDDLHGIVESVVGVSSLKSLTCVQANKIIDYLQEKSGQTRHIRRRRKQRLSSGPATMELTPAQAYKLKKLKERLAWTEDRLNGFVKRQTGIDRWEWLPRLKAVWVIQAMVEMAEREI